MLNSIKAVYEKLTQNNPQSSAPRPRYFALLVLLASVSIFFFVTTALVIQYYQNWLHAYAGSQTWDFGMGSDYQFDADHVQVQSGMAELKVPWWDSHYSSREIMKLENLGGNTVDALTPSTVTVNSADLGNFLNNCYDAHLVYYNGSANQELPVDVAIAAGASGCNDSKATRLTFQLPVALAGSSSNTQFYLYHGYAAASAQTAPTDALNVGAATTLLGVDLHRDLAAVDGSTPTASSGTGRFAGQSAAVSFNGADDALAVASSTSFNISDNLTLEAWVSPKMMPAADQYLLHRNGNYFLKINATGKLAGGLWNGSSWVIATSSATLSLNTFAHVAMTFDRHTSTNQLKLWLNGNQDGAATSTVPIPASSSTLYVSGNGSNSGFAGYLSAARLSSTVRYSQAFTPALAPWSNDDYTVLLLPLDGSVTDNWSSLTQDGSGHGATITVNGNPGLVRGLSGVDGNNNDSGPVPAGSLTKLDGLVIERGTSNLVLNPSFEAGTYNSHWSSSGLSASNNSSVSFARFGAHSVKLDNTYLYADGTYTTALNPGASTVSLSAFVYNATSGSLGGTVTNSVAELYYDNATVTTIYQNLGGGWWRLAAENVSASLAVKDFGVAVKAGQHLYLDGFQVEANQASTSYCDGSLGTGYAWTGSANNSTSTRSDDVLHFLTTGHVQAAAGSLSLWVEPLWRGTDGVEHALFTLDTSVGQFKLFKSSAGQLTLNDGVHDATFDVSVWVPGKWYQVVANWGSGDMQLYVNGVAGAVSGGFNPPSLGSTIHVGADISDQNQADAVIAEVRIADAPFNSGQIAALVNAKNISRSEFVPTISNATYRPIFTKLVGFDEVTGGGHNGLLTYQLSNDGGSTWYMHQGNAWVVAPNGLIGNDASTVNSNVSSFVSEVGSGAFAFRTYFTGPSPQLSSITLDYQNAPAAPTTLYVDNTSAQTGRANPISLTSSTPAFSAVYQDADSGDTATKAEIQVSTDNSFGSITHWDSGASGTAIASVNIGSRNSNLVYGSFGSTPLQSLTTNDGNVTYYYRLRFWDAEGNTGVWSSPAAFGMQDSPAAPSLLVATSITPTAISLSWTDNASGQSQEDSFDLQHSTDGSMFTQLNAPAANVTTFAHTSLLPNTFHVYKIRAQNGAGNSAYSSVLSRYTAANTPGAPILSNGDYTKMHVILDNGSNPASVLLAVAISSDNFVHDTRYVQANLTLATTLHAADWKSYADFGSEGGILLSGLSGGETYTVKVKARNTDELETPFSNNAQLTTWIQPSLSLVLEGTNRGEIDLSGQNGLVAITQVLPNVPKTAVEKVSIVSNAQSGYSVYISASQKMALQTNSSVVVDFVKNGTVGTNAAPVAWASPLGTTVGEDTAFVGYHTSDGSLGTGTHNRFANPDTWAGFDDLKQFYEVLYNGTASSGEIEGKDFAYLTFKFESNNLQPSGNYTDLQLNYKVVPIF